MRWRSGRGREETTSALAPTSTALLDALPLEWAIVDEAGRLQRTSPRFRDLGLTRRDALAAEGLLDLVARTRLLGSRQSLEFPVGGAALSGRRLQASAGLLPGGSVLVSINDVSAASRVDEIGRAHV